MLQSWSEASATWHSFGDGIEPDDYRARSMTSFAIHAPERGIPVMADVTADVAA